MRPLVVLLMLGSLTASADKAASPEATALFEQGLKDLQAGNLDAACKELRDSLAAYNDSGTEGALATCYTKQNKIASAWTLWKDLVDTAPTQVLKDAATQAANELEPRLPHYQLHLAAPPVPGFTLKINGNLVKDPTISVPLPVDPGVVLIEATAPDYKGWSNTVNATEQQLVTIEVPALVALPKAPTTGTLHITSSAPNATVRIDGKAYGTAPVDVELDASSHTLEVVASGYNTRRESVGVTPGQKRDFVVVLDKVVVTTPVAPPPEHHAFYTRLAFWIPVAVVLVGGAVGAYEATRIPPPINGTLSPGAGGVQ